MVSLIPTHKTVMIHPTIPPMKVELLKRKASSPGNVTNESYTPMKAQGEVDSFGVYESNTTRTHIFVGPFTIKRKKEETITPGTPDTTTTEEDSEEERQYPTPDEMGIAAPCCKYSRVHPYIISGPYIAMCKGCKTRATIYYDTDNAYSTEGAEDDAETKERPPIGSPSDEGLRDTGSVRARRAVAGERDRKKPKTQRPRPNRPPENTNTGEQTNANPVQHTPGTDTTGNARAGGSTSFVVEANTLQEWLRQNEVIGRSNTRQTGELLTDHHETLPRLPETPVGWSEHCCNITGKWYYSRRGTGVTIEVKGANYFGTRTQRDRHSDESNNNEFKRQFRELNLSRPTQHKYATRSSTNTIRMIAYQCGTCQVAFQRRADLRTHKLTQHRE